MTGRIFSEATESALRAMILLAHRQPRNPMAVLEIAQVLKVSGSYLSKTIRSLAKAGIVDTHPGPHRGVSLRMDASKVSLRAILEAVQGKITPSFCAEVQDLQSACGFHQAAAEIHGQLGGTLEKWTLAALSAKPCPDSRLTGGVPCRMNITKGAIL